MWRYSQNSHQKVLLLFSTCFLYLQRCAEKNVLFNIDGGVIYFRTLKYDLFSFLKYFWEVESMATLSF